MEIIDVDKIIIVEGKSDKKRIQQIINEPVHIICTNGTISVTRLDELMEDIFDKEVYILVDADDSGDKLRRLFKREFPEAEHLYIDRMYREVASAPYHHIATVLLSANIDINTEYLQ
ncbi:toprim domain-containing protein [Sutcliffiella halmapala]|uniref:toprim domain-containing protein n=1 Tax=Sutcliffiella halmapala TaxID=79882 RepID=UPI0009952CF3|nr:toprim domain-containing protein [Sutcliffiella halmapala]